MAKSKRIATPKTPKPVPMASPLPANDTDELTAITLKDKLWDTLKKVRAGEMPTANGDVVASQAREILRTVKAQLAILAQASEGVTGELINFAKPKRR